MSVLASDTAAQVASPMSNARPGPWLRPASRRSKRLRYLALSMAAVTVGFCTASGLMLYDLRQNTYAQAVNGEVSLLGALSQDIARNIEVYDLSLQGVVDGLSEPELSGVDPHLQDLVLYDRAASAKDLGAILVLDRDGKVVRGSKPEAIGAQLGDREYFLAQKAAPDRGLFISAPFRRRVTGNDEVVALSRAVRALDGSFAGVVVGTLRLAYFRDLFSRSQLGPHGSINLLRTDGVSLMRAPYDADQFGHDYSGSANFRRMAQAPSGTFTGRSSIDGVDRIYSFCHIGSLPLVLNATLAEDDVFAVWRSKATIIVLALGALCATAVGLGIMLKRQLRRTALAEEALMRSEAQYRLFADHAQDVIVRLDHRLSRTYVSPAVTPMLGYVPAELLDQALGNLVHPDDWPEIAVVICASQARRANTEATYRLRHKAGHYVWVEGRYSPVVEDGGFVIVVRDIAKRKLAEERLEAVNAELARVARSDALTGLPNRRAFDEALEREWRRAVRDEAPLSLLMIDVDRFKAYNDRYGHQEGDACLRAVAGAVASAVRRPGDLAARYGGEELAVILPGTDEVGATQVAERVRAAVEVLGLPHLGNVDCGAVVTASLGCGTMRPAEPGGGMTSLLTMADARLYEAKRLGRNRVGTATLAAAPAHLPADEDGRLRACRRYARATTFAGRDNLDRIARLAAQVFDVPMAFVSLVDAEEAWLVGRHNVDVERAPRQIVYCNHTILGDEPFVVPSTGTDPRFADNSLTRNGIGFYAGAPLITEPDGQRVGALCVADRQARTGLDEGQRRLLAGLARLAMGELERQRAADTSTDTAASSHEVARTAA